MGKTFIQGLAVLIGGLVALALDQFLNLGLGSILFGLAVGSILGLVNNTNGGPIGRVGAFVVGIVVAIVIYLVRVLLLNDSFAGQVAAVVLALALLTVICALTGGRLPLWAALLGSALVIGPYESSFVNAPQNVQSELFQYVTAALVPAALGYLATIFVADRVQVATEGDAAAARGRPPNTDPNPSSVSLTRNSEV